MQRIQVVRVLVHFCHSIYVVVRSTSSQHCPAPSYSTLHKLVNTMGPENMVALSPKQAVSFLTLRTKLISWIDKNPKSGDEAGKNGKPAVSKRREQVRRAQK